ncbi:MAG TPA: formimidoylglutamase [Nevskiaceae bacterium]|nr:formimidoylglutamase [Nevskiaceae bacterium]
MKPNDPRLGDLVARATLGDAHVVIIGCAQDEGVRRNGGRPGAAQAPAEIRRALYKLTTNGLGAHSAPYDAGDTPIGATLEDTHAAHQEAVRKLLDAGKRVIVLGGGNDISYPDCSALAASAGEVLAFNVDAHFDVRDEQPRNSGTPYRQLLEEGVIQPARFHEIGSVPWSNSSIYARWLAEQRVQVTPLDDLRRRGVERTFRRFLREGERAKAVFWGLDVDVVRASDAPGVSAPNPLGMSGEEFCAIAALAGAEPRTRVIEFTECNPALDVDNRTSRLVAVAIFHYLAAFAQAKRK